MDYDILDGIISPKAIKEIEDFEKKCLDSASRINEAFKGISLGSTTSSSGGSSRGGGSTEFDAVVEATKKLTQAQNGLAVSQQKIMDQTAQARVSSQYLTQQRKLEAQAIDENATQLQRLYALQELANRKAQAEYIPGQKQQTQAFIDAVKVSNNYTKEIGLLENATGKLQGKTNSMYGATFSLTQIMRELPNFAISSRIGFMSLSNNIPQLWENFKRLAEEINPITGKTYGMLGAFKMFAGSLLSMNTILIAVSTLLVIYGDDIGKWISKIFSAEAATNKLTISQKALYAVLSGKAGTAQKTMEEIMKLGIEVQKYGGNTKDAKIIVDEFNKTFNTHLTTIEQVRLAYPKMAKSFIESAIAMQAAMSEIDVAATQERRKSGLQLLLSGYSKEDIAKTKASIDAMLEIWGKYKLNREALFGEIIKADKNFSTFEQRNENINILISTGKATQDDLKRFSEAQNVIGMNLRQGKKELVANVAAIRDADIKFQNASNAAYKLLPAPDTMKQPKAAAGTTHSAREINAKADYYDPMRGRMVEEMARLEIQTQKETTDGVVNGYNDRRIAAAKYYQWLLNLSASDLKFEMFNEEEKLNAAKKAAAKKLEDAKKLEAAGKMTPGELAKTQKEYNDTITTLNGNFYAKSLELKDKHDKSILAGEIQFKKTLYGIKKDEIAENVRLIDEGYAVQMDIIKNQNAKAKVDIEKMSTIDLIGSIFGVSKDNTLQQKALEHKKQLDELNAKYLANREKINAVGISSTEGKSLADEQIRLTQQIIDAQYQYDIDMAQLAQDRKSEIFKKGIETMASLYNQFYANYYKQLDKERTKFGKIETEKEKDVDDRLAAGVITERQASEEKARDAAYYQSQLDELDRKKAEAQKQQFFASQAMSLGQVVFNTAQGVTNYAAKLATIPLIPWVISLGALQAGLILATTIPQFKDGTDSSPEGLAILGDGGKNELYMMPSGKWGISPDVSTLFNLEKGTKVFPDVNKIDLVSMLALAQGATNDYDMRRIEHQLISLNKTMSKQRPVRFRGMPLIQQLKRSEQLARRNRSLMN